MSAASSLTPENNSLTYVGCVHRTPGWCTSLLLFTKVWRWRLVSVAPCKYVASRRRRRRVAAPRLMRFRIRNFTYIGSRRMCLSSCVEFCTALPACRCSLLRDDPISSNDPRATRGQESVQTPRQFAVAIRLTLPIGFPRIDELLLRSNVRCFLHSSVHEDYVYQGGG